MQPAASDSGRGTGRAAFDLEWASRLLVGVLRLLLRTTKTDAHRLHHKNADTLRLSIQLSKRKAAKKTAAKAKAPRHAKERDHLLHGLPGMRCRFN
ncbi:hypothetical protein D1007_39092 [Hordeum vulgare]|nr:hypothetical protein D1007_39092 [Hordeum vulgare]